MNQNSEQKVTQVTRKPSKQLSHNYQLRVAAWLDQFRRQNNDWAKFGLHKESPSAKSIITLLDQPIKHFALSIVSGDHYKPKFSKYWERFLCGEWDMLTNKEVLEVINSTNSRLKYVLDKPYIQQKVSETVLGRLLVSISTENELIQKEIELTKRWIQQRPKMAEYAEITAKKSIRVTHKLASSKHQELLQWCYMLGHRILDSHITGTREVEDFQYKYLDLTLDKLTHDEQQEFTKRQFVKIGHTINEEWGLLANNENILHQVILACTGHSGSFNYDNFISTLVREIAPILSTPTYQLAQKGLGSPETISELLELANTRELISMHTSSNLELEAPQGLVENIDLKFLAENQLFPQHMTELEIPSYAHLNYIRGLEIIKKHMPEFTSAASKVNWTGVMVAPLFLTAVKAELSGYLPHLDLEDTDTTALMEELAQNQQQVFQQMLAAYKFKDEKIVKRKVNAPESINWVGHKEWVLLPEHIKDMEKDGLDARTIKMSGVYSVINEEEKTRIISRLGRSQPRKGLEGLGKLMVFPNPLIYFEQHSKTELAKPKYVAPDNSCSPPMIVPVQADFTQENSAYLQALNGEQMFQFRRDSLGRLRKHEMLVDLSTFTEELLAGGYHSTTAANLARALLEKTSWRLYLAMTDPEADIEITEGQKKTYSMYKSYKHLIELEALRFAAKIPLSATKDEIEAIVKDMPIPRNKLFVCSPGVWQPVKSWKKFSKEEQEEFLQCTGSTASNGTKSPLNPNCKYALTPVWVQVLPWQERRVIVTYDQDADKNISVAQSISALAQGILDVAPHAKVLYRSIVEFEGVKAKGADDFIVAHGAELFWNGLQVGEVAPNVSFEELNSSGTKSYIGYLLQKASKCLS